MALFGDLNSTVAKTIAENSPKYRTIIEPFADAGTYSLYTKKKKPKSHIVNIVDEILFNAYTFVKSVSGSEISALKKMDWTGTKETFDKAVKINATNGIMFFYSWYYQKHFTAKTKDETAPPTFDISKIGLNVKAKIPDLRGMRKSFKIVTFTNDDPFKWVKSGGDNFLVMLPKTPEDNDSVRSRIKTISGNFYYSAKAKEFTEIVEDSIEFNTLVVSPLTVATIMMGEYRVIKNYESNILPIDNEIILKNV